MGDQADWMSQLCPRLWDVPLHHLSIPGEYGANLTISGCGTRLRWGFREDAVNHCQWLCLADVLEDATLAGVGGAGGGRGWTQRP